MTWTGVFAVEMGKSRNAQEIGRRSHGLYLEMIWMDVGVKDRVT